MTPFYLTFGNGYAHGGSWVRVMAPSYDAARRAAFEHFGRKWSFLRSEADFDPRFFPEGELFAFETDEDLNYRRLHKRVSDSSKDGAGRRSEHPDGNWTIGG